MENGKLEAILAGREISKNLIGRINGLEIRTEHFVFQMPLDTSIPIAELLLTLKWNYNTTKWIWFQALNKHQFNIWATKYFIFINCLNCPRPAPPTIFQKTFLEEFIE